jgi:hypothetical protein
MTKPINAFLIDPYAIRRHFEDASSSMADVYEQAVREVWIMNNLQGYYAALTEPNVHTVSCVTMVPVGYVDPKLKDDDIFVDDEGLFNTRNTWFLLRGYPQPLAGKGLVLGTTRHGNSCAPRKTTLEWLRRNVMLASDNAIFNYRNPDCFELTSGDAVRFWLNNKTWSDKGAWK